MGIILLIITTVIAGFIFYMIDTNIHRKIMVNSTILNHWNDRFVVRELNEEIKDSYPNLSMAAKGFLNSSVRFDSDEMSKNVKVVKGAMKENITNEIQKIMDTKDDTASRVAAWYILACMQINLIKNKNADNVEKLVKEANENRLEDMKDEEVFCFS